MTGSRASNGHRILLTGATGKTGQLLLQRFTAAGQTARLLVRDPQAAARLAGRGFEVVTGDLREVGDVQRALDGISHAFMLMANQPDQADVEKDFIRAAEAVGLKRLVKMSAIGADSQSSALLKRFHGEAEDRLRSSRLGWTILQPGFFMDNLLTAAAAIRQQGVLAWPMGSGQVGTVDLRDVADAAFVALTADGHEGQSYVLTGPELLTFEDMAQVLSSELGRTVRYHDIDPEVFRQQLLGVGVPAWNVDAMLQLFELNRLGMNATVTDDLQAVLGRPPRRLDEFVRDHAQQFGAA